MKKYFFTGFISLFPLALTIVIALWLFNFFTAPLAGITESIILTYEKKLGLSLEHREHLVYFLSRVFALIMLIVFIFLIGFCGQRFLSAIFLKIPQRIFAKIPIVGAVFRLSNDLTKAIFSDSKKTFQETVLIPFPGEDSLTLGFITGNTPEHLNQGPFKTDVVIFIPTAPHPMSGYVLFAPKKIIQPVDVSVEDAFKFLISCGVIHPGEKTPGQK